MAKKYDREQLIADWKAGEFTQKQLSYKYDISQQMVAKIVKGIKQDLMSLVVKKVEVEQELKELSSKEVVAVTTATTHRLGLISDIELFSSKAIKKAHELLSMTESGQDLRHIVEAVDKISITNNINERHAKPTQIQNNMQNNVYAQLSVDEIERELKQLNERVVI